MDGRSKGSLGPGSVWRCLLKQLVSTANCPSMLEPFAWLGFLPRLPASRQLDLEQAGALELWSKGYSEDLDLFKIRREAKVSIRGECHLPGSGTCLLVVAAPSSGNANGALNGAFDDS